MRMALFVVLAVGICVTATRADEDPPPGQQAVNGVEWDKAHPKGGVGTLDVKGTYTTAQGWTCTEIYIEVYDQQQLPNGKAIATKKLAPPGNPWSHQFMIQGPKQVLVKVKGTFSDGKGGTDTKSPVDGSTTVK